MIKEIVTGIYERARLWPETWASHTTYSLDDVVKPTTYNNYTYVVTTAGSTVAAEPTWSVSVDDTISSGTCVFTAKDQKTYNTIAPQTAVVPYVTFGLLTESPIGDFADFESVEDLTFWVNCFASRSVADVYEMADEVMTALDDTTVSATGYTNMKCVREFISNPEYDIETGIHQVSLRYRLWMDKT